MRWVRRILYSLLAFLLLGSSIIAAWVGLWMPTSLPQTTGTVTLPGIRAPVEIVRDLDGIVTIRAQGEADAAFALGYVHAQDRLVQMEMMRRLVAGRLSEVLGSMTLSTDRSMRVLGLYRAAEQSEATLPDDVRAGVCGFVSSTRAVARCRLPCLGPPHGPAAQRQFLVGALALPPVAVADDG
jgi:penicillin amidase